MRTKHEKFAKHPNKAAEVAQKQSTAGKYWMICLEPLRGAQLTVLSCMDVFHTACVARWLRARRTCPIFHMVVSARVRRDLLEVSGGTAGAGMGAALGTPMTEDTTTN